MPRKMLKEEKKLRRVMAFPISGRMRMSVDALYGFAGCLPRDAHIIGVREDSSSLCINIFIESEHFPECEEGNIAPRVPLWITRHDDGLETAEWRWKT